MATIPISQELFDELVEMRGRIDGADGPFVPYVGPFYGAGTPRIAFIGKATASWDHDEPPTLAGQIAEARRFVKECLLEGSYRSSFWNFVIDCTLDLTGHDRTQPQAADWALGRIVWSNLMKIAVNGGNPIGQAAASQRDLARRILKFELDALSPDCVIITTSEYEGDLVWSVFGDDWTDLGDTELGTQVARNQPDGTRVYYTVHPQGKATELRESIIREIVADFEKR